MKFQDSDSGEDWDAGDVDENWRLQRLEREKWVKGIFSLFINGFSRVKEDGSLAGGGGGGKKKKRGEEGRRRGNQWGVVLCIKK